MKKIYFKPEIKCYNIKPCVLKTESVGHGTTGGGGYEEGAKLNIFDDTGSGLLDGSIGDMGSDLLDLSGENDLFNYNTRTLCTRY